MLRAAHRRAGGRGHLRYAAANRRTGPRPGTSRLSAGRKAQDGWWRRLADDREFVGMKLFALAALFALVALLERAV